MSFDLLTDSDVLLKLCMYQLRVWEAGNILGSRKFATLGASKFILPKRLKRCSLAGDREPVLESWKSLDQALDFVEPSTAELELAAKLEVSAQRLGVAFDTGESQLVAIMAVRGAALFLSGDKRAICALPSLLPLHSELTGVEGNVASLEQLFIELASTMELTALRGCVCAEPKADRTLAICFKCSSGDGASREVVIEGLTSYANDLRKNSSNVLIGDQRILASPSKEDSERGNDSCD